MIEKAKQNWREFKESEPGHRFQDRYERRQRESHGPLDPGKVINILAGVIVAVLGVIFIPMPGPGSLIIALGVGLIGCEFQPVARFLDTAELRWRKLHKHAMQEWRQFPVLVRLLAVLIAFSIAVAGGYGIYQLLFEQQS
jgi:uncharacterized protein (TIGR02611 family)